MDRRFEGRRNDDENFRAPGIEELFSDGPHLAAYSYEIGNSELGTENGWGTEAFLRYSRNRVKLNLAVFSNQIYGYLIPANTGEKEWGSGAAGWLWIYQYTGLDAVLDGAELSVDAEIVPRVYAQVRMSYVRGTLKDSDVPIERDSSLQRKISAPIHDSTVESPCDSKILGFAESFRRI